MMPESDLFALKGFRTLLRTCGAVFVIALVLALLDMLWGVQIPQPFRASIPWVLIVSSAVGTVILVGSLGMPKRPLPDAEADEEKHA